MSFDFLSLYAALFILSSDISMNLRHDEHSVLQLAISIDERNHGPSSSLILVLHRTSFFPNALFKASPHQFTTGISTRWFDGHIISIVNCKYRLHERVDTLLISCKVSFLCICYSYSTMVFFLHFLMSLVIMASRQVKPGGNH